MAVYAPSNQSVVQVTYAIRMFRNQEPLNTLMMQSNRVLMRMKTRPLWVYSQMSRRQRKRRGVKREGGMEGSRTLECAPPPPQRVGTEPVGRQRCPSVNVKSGQKRVFGTGPSRASAGARHSRLSLDVIACTDCAVQLNVTIEAALLIAALLSCKSVPVQEPGMENAEAMRRKFTTERDEQGQRRWQYLLHKGSLQTFHQCPLHHSAQYKDTQNGQNNLLDY